MCRLSVDAHLDMIFAPCSGLNRSRQPLRSNTPQIEGEHCLPYRISAPRRRCLPLIVATSLIVFGASLDAGAAAPLEKVNMSFSQKNVDFLPMDAAVDAGYFQQHGIDANVRYLPAEEGVPALVAGQVQVVGIGGSDAVSAAAAGIKLKLVMSYSPINLFQFWARPQYNSAKALKGHRVGITSTTGSLYTATLLALEALGLKPSDVAMTPLGGIVNVNNSLMSGSIDAAASHPPATYQFERAGFVDLVDLVKKKIPSVSSGVWVSEDYIKTHRATVQNVVDALAETVHRMSTDRAFAETEIMKHLGIKDKGELDFTYDFYANDIFPLGRMPQVDQIQSDKDWLAASNPKVKNVNVADMIDQSFLNNVPKDIQK
jgi:NitT/TauT family transport system substrate-binding protein